MDAAPVETPTIVRDRMMRPIRDLRLSVMDRCNFRCPYCMPAEVFGPGYTFIPRDRLLSLDEMARLARAFVALGVTKLRLTGGEPLLRNDIAAIAGNIAAIPGLEDLALTTNGIRLAALAEPLAAAGLQRVNVSLDALDPTVFARMSGERGRVSTVLKGIDAAERAGLGIKVNAVVQRGVNESEIVPLAGYFRRRKIALRFIEYMDVGNHNGWKPDQVYPSARIRAAIEQEAPLIPLPPAVFGEVASRFRYRDHDAEVGFISSVTQPFCRNCVRARVSADGKLYTCLFATEGHDLRPWLGEGVPDADRLEHLAGIWHRRDDRYSELRGQPDERLTDRQKLEMSYIGG